ncbi:MAG TPA: helix-turn-helix domain-containing protein, partial [Terriglobales bacterium]
PFAVAQQQAAFTAFESANAPAPQQQLPNGRSLPRLVIPEGGTSLEEVERAFVEMAMKEANGNQTHAARLLDISRDALRYKLKKFGLMHGEEDDIATAAN